MNYYRLALQHRHTAVWTWKSTVVTSLGTVFQLLRMYRVLPLERLRVCSSTCREDLVTHMPDCARNHSTMRSVSATEFLHERKLQVGEVTQQVPDRGTAETTPRQPTALALASSWHVSSGVSGSPGANGGAELERKRLANERGPGADHDLPYTFALPTSLPQILAWIRLSAKVRSGELEP